MAQLVASVIASTTDEMVRAMRESVRGADLVEARLDSVSDPDLDRLRQERSKPIILTCRSPAEGGQFQGSEEERLALLRRALDLGFDYVDVETSSATAELLAHRNRSKVILSHHVFDHCPSDLDSPVRRAVDLGADMVKLAVKCPSIADARRLAEAGFPARERRIGYTPVALGPSGVPARILASRFGADFTYASARGSPPAGPGQLDLDELLSLYRYRSVGVHTWIYGILGNPVAGSLSPAMHNAVFAQRGWDAVYLPFEEEVPAAFAAAARALGMAGLSVTRPHKEAILAFLDEIDPEARRIGAVNTIVVRKGKWFGYNTDVAGVIRPISKRIDIQGKLALICGAGGAARAAAFGLARQGAKVVILARGYQKAVELAGAVGAGAGRLEEADRWSWDILINATPVGSAGVGGELPVPAGSIGSGSVVLDMVYDPERTALMEMAERGGARAISGLEMLVTQAACQSEIWTGRMPSSLELERAARAEIARRNNVLK